MENRNRLNRVVSETSLPRIMENLQLKIKEASIEEYKSEAKPSFTYFAFIVRSKQESSKYKWKITKDSKDFEKLLRSLQTELGTHNLSTPAWPGKKAFKKLPEEEKLDLAQNLLKSVISNTTYRKTQAAADFLEVSTKSFEGSCKFKEGFVFKMGSGRVSNQKKCWTCYNALRRVKRRWLRLTEKGVEYMMSNVHFSVLEVIPFQAKFEVFTGRIHALRSDAIRIKTPQHNFVFRTGNEQKRDEWYNAITEALGLYEKKNGKASSRYGSSFVARRQNEARFYVDAENYFSDVFESLVSAQKYVYITDWWMSPDLFLKRPPEDYPDTQIFQVLGKLADKGVKVFILLYKEVSLSLSINSLYTKDKLVERNRNIRVMRHPNFSIRGGVFLWSHHSKMVCIDGVVGFMGGLDLCYGRFDTHTHNLTDTEPPHKWNGIDYSNVRIADFTEVQHWDRDILPRGEIPRMPWHDAAIRVKGKVVEDMCTHFRELWNHVVRDITGLREGQEMIPLSYKEPVYRRDTRLKTKIKANLQRILGKKEEEPKGIIRKLTSKKEEEKGVVYSKQESSGFLQNLGEKNIRIFSEFLRGSLNPQPQAKKIVQQVPEEQIQHKAELEEKDTEKTKNELISKFNKGLGEVLLRKTKSEYDFETLQATNECQLVRSAGLWSFGREETEASIHKAYIQEIQNAQHFVYIENQFFMSSTAGKTIKNQIAHTLVEKILEKHQENKPFLVIVCIPLLPAFEGSIDDPSAAVLRVQMHWQYQTICRGHNSVYEKLKRQGVSNPKDYIRFYSMRNHGVLDGTPVTEMVYIHSKLMIVDDRTVIIGSANLNDRSMLGTRDAEIAMVLKDSKCVYTKMQGADYQASKFAHELRLQLFEEISGLKKELLVDPLCEGFLSAWNKVACKNTYFYRKVFRCYPDSNIKRIADVASYQKKNPSLQKYQTYVHKVSGFLVKFPLKFLEKENLKIKVSNKEFLLPDFSFV